MASLKAKQRNKLRDSQFAYPSRRAYPIDTKPRARNALARAAQSQTFGTYEHVARAVRKKWGSQIPSVAPRKGRVTRPGKARRRSRR